MIKLLSNSNIVFGFMLLILLPSCKNINNSNIGTRKNITELLDTHKIHGNALHTLPLRAKLNDSINSPQFIGGFDICKEIIYKDLGRIYAHRSKEGYSNIHLSLKISKLGIASELKKSIVVSRDNDIDKEFKEIYPNILNNLKGWKPATNKRDNQTVEYNVHIEIESNDGKNININY